MSYRRTDKFPIARVISAAAVLLDNSTPADNAAVNRIVLGRAAYLIQTYWQLNFPVLRSRWQIINFWRRIRTQTLRNEEIVDFIAVYDQTVNPPGCDYGQNVRLELKTQRGPIHHAINITAKKD